jgi:hypothetical protein
MQESIFNSPRLRKSPDYRWVEVIFLFSYLLIVNIPRLRLGQGPVSQLQRLIILLLYSLSTTPACAKALIPLVVDSFRSSSDCHQPTPAPRL